MILPLYYYDHPVLKQRAATISTITPDIVRLAENMAASVIHYNGLGLAASQVGQLVRLFVIRNTWIDKDDNQVLGDPEFFLNPTITPISSRMIEIEEGCLSVPGLYLKINRPARLRVRYQTLDGCWMEEEVDDFRARVILHENDHLNGVLHFTRIPSAMRRKLESRLESIRSQYQERSGQFI